MLIVVASILITAAWYYGQTAAQKTYDQLLRGAAIQIVNSVIQRDNQLIVDLPSSAFELLGFAENDRIFYKIVGPDGALISGYNDLHGNEALDPSRFEPKFATISYKGTQVRTITLARALSDPARTGWIYLVLGQTMQARGELASEITRGALLIMLVMVLVALAGTLLAVRYALKPVTNLAEALSRRNPEDLTALQTRVPLELQPFVGAINHFMTKLDERVVRLQKFIADAAHQIRTPITALSVQMDVLDLDSLGDKNRERLERIRGRTRELSRLTNQLLSHAMVIHRAGAVELQKVNIVEVARTAFNHAIPITIDPDVVVSFEAEQRQLHVKGDAVSLREAISNFINNALLHGTITRLSVRVQREGQRIHVEVADDGPGIPPEKWQSLTERFSSSSTTGNPSGLGFAIASEVAAAHGGTIFMRHEPGGDFCVVLDLPQQEGEN